MFDDVSFDEPPRQRDGVTADIGQLESLGAGQLIEQRALDI